jgi:hypothetical protein
MQHLRRGGQQPIAQTAFARSAAGCRIAHLPAADVVGFGRVVSLRAGKIPVFVPESSLYSQ